MSPPSSDSPKEHSKSKKGRKHGRRRPLNADLFDDNDEDERDAEAIKRVLSPTSLWKEVQFQQHLKVRMRKNMQAKAQVVDGKGRLVTLAERIVRYKLKEASIKSEDDEEASTSEASAKDETLKTQNLASLLHEYIVQRRCESALSSALLDEISEAKIVLSENEFKRALPEKIEQSCSSSISLGESATNYKVKADSMAPRNSDPEPHDAHQEKDVITVKDTENNSGSKGAEKLRVVCDVHRPSRGHEDEEEVIAGKDAVPHGDREGLQTKAVGDIQTDTAQDEKKEGNGDNNINVASPAKHSNLERSDAQQGKELPSKDAERASGTIGSEMVQVVCEVHRPSSGNMVEKDEIVTVQQNGSVEEMGDFKTSTTQKKEMADNDIDANLLIDDGKCNGNKITVTQVSSDLVSSTVQTDRKQAVSDSCSSEVLEPKDIVSDSAASSQTVKSDDRTPEVKKSASPSPDTRVVAEFETDSAIESLDFTDLNDNLSGADTSTDTRVHRVYQFRCCDLERSYSLPELGLSDARGVFTTAKDTNNRKRGRKVTIISSGQSINTPVTARSLQNASSEGEIPLLETPPEFSASETPKTNTDDSAHVSSGGILSPASSTTRENSKQDQRPPDSTTVGPRCYGPLDCPRSIGNSWVPGGNRILDSLLSPRRDCEVNPLSQSGQAPSDREKRIIGLYNELKCYSMLQGKEPSIAISMTTRPNGSTDLNIQWGAISTTRKHIIKRRNRKHKKTKKDTQRTDSSSLPSTKKCEGNVLINPRKPEISTLSETPPNKRMNGGIDNNIFWTPRVQTHRNPPEFIYLRELSISHYVAKVLDRCKDSPYYPPDPLKMPTMFHTSLCPPELLKEPKKSNGQLPRRDWNTTHQKREETPLKLPAIKSSDDTTNLVGSRSRQNFAKKQAESDGNPLLLRTRQEALERRRKRLKLT